jgi:hypothetical protein
MRSRGNGKCAGKRHTPTLPLRLVARSYFACWSRSISSPYCSPSTCRSLLSPYRLFFAFSVACSPCLTALYLLPCRSTLRLLALGRLGGHFLLIIRVILQRQNHTAGVTLYTAHVCVPNPPVKVNNSIAVELDESRSN